MPSRRDSASEWVGLGPPWRVGGCRKPSNAHPPVRGAPVPPGRWVSVGSLLTGITHWVTPSPSTPSTPEAQKDKTVIKQCEQCEQWKQQCKECKQCNQLLARCSNNSIVVSFNGLIKCNLEGSFFVQLRFRRFVIVSDSYMLCN